MVDFNWMRYVPRCVFGRRCAQCKQQGKQVSRRRLVNDSLFYSCNCRFVYFLQIWESFHKALKMWLIRGQEILESKPSITLFCFAFYCRYFELGQEPKVSSCSISLLFPPVWIPATKVFLLNGKSAKAFLIRLTAVRWSKSWLIRGNGWIN